MNEGIKSTIVAGRSFDDGVELFAAVVSVDLPGITLATVDIKGPGVMGTIAVPSTGQLDNMEHVVHIRGAGTNTERLARPGQHKQEFRYVQDNYDPATGVMKQDQIKIFLDGLFREMDGGSVEQGAAIERSVTYNTRRMQVFINGRETVLIDKTQQQWVIDGVDHWAPIRNALA